MRKILVTGGTGFVGKALLPALVAAGHEVRATTRDVSRAVRMPHVAWVRCDVDDPADVARALAGMDAAHFLVHGIGAGQRDYAAMERSAARHFAEAAGRAGVKRIVYLGGVAPSAEASRRLQSRLDVGEILRAGPVPTLELRASMIIGSGSASWQIVRDLAMRLPAMVLPSWTESRTCPVAIQDVTVALVRGLEIPLSSSAWYDIPGPEVISVRELVARLAALRGRKVPSVRVPLLTVSLSSLWLRLVTRADFALARELVLVSLAICSRGTRATGARSATNPRGPSMRRQARPYHTRPQSRPCAVLLPSFKGRWSTASARSSITRARSR